MEQLYNLKGLFPFIEDISVNGLNVNYVKKVIPKGETIFHEGDRCEGVPFVIKGCVRVSKFGKNGKEMSVYRVNSGDTCILSVTSVLSNSTYPLTAIAEEDVEAVIVPCDDFKLIMTASLNFQEYIYKTIICRFQEVINIIDEIIFHSIDERIAKFLLKNTKNSGDVIEITHDKIAVEIGTAREVVSRLLKEMERNGWIKLARGKVIVKKRDQLKLQIKE
ncbi:MAG: Crp/Fnr family transcriptional regulator [Lysinibacillus sp.]|nr:Crp/Fnr family transcriptional regulator [Lysinibacillus sp.]